MANLAHARSKSTSHMSKTSSVKSTNAASRSLKKSHTHFNRLHASADSPNVANDQEDDESASIGSVDPEEQLGASLSIYS